MNEYDSHHVMGYLSKCTVGLTDEWGDKYDLLESCGCPLNKDWTIRST